MAQGRKDVVGGRIYEQHAPLTSVTYVSAPTALGIALSQGCFFFCGLILFVIAPSTRWPTSSTWSTCRVTAARAHSAPSIRTAINRVNAETSNFEILSEFSPSDVSTRHDPWNVFTTDFPILRCSYSENFIFWLDPFYMLQCDHCVCLHCIV